MTYAHLLSVASLATLAGTACMAQDWHGVPYEAGAGAWGPSGYIFDLKTWDPDGAGSSPPVLVIAGSFSTVGLPGGGSFVANNICVWNGCTFVPLADTSLSTSAQGFNGVVYALEVYNGDLYAGGNFTSADGSAAYSLAKWNGTTWVQAGGGVYDNPSAPSAGIVHCMKTFGSGSSARLYVGGEFLQCGGTTTNALAKWDGSSWTNLDASSCVGTSSPGKVYSLATAGSYLIAGGDFAEVAGTVAADAAWFDGSVWNRTSAVYGVGEDLKVPPGCTGCNSLFRTSAYAVGVTSSHFWVGGTNVLSLSYDYCNPPGSPTAIDMMANSTGTTWSDGGGAGAGPEMVASAEFDTIGGVFYAAGNRRAFPSSSPTGWVHNVTAWSGSSWNGVGSYLTGEVRAIEEYQGELYVGGNFGGAEATIGGTTRTLPGTLAKLTLQCSVIDVGSTGGSPISDGVINNNDSVVYTDLFFGGCLQADIGSTGGVPGPDGQLDNNDWVVFYSLYFGGC